MSLAQKLKNSFQGDGIIWIIYIAFCIISVIEIFSATSSLTYKAGSHWSPLLAHTAKMIVSFALLWVTHRMTARYLTLGTLGLPFSWILLGVVFLMNPTNSAHRWINIFGIQFQPSELAKLMLIIMVARLLAMYQTENGATQKAFNWILICTGITCGLIVTENLTTCLLICTTIFIMMILGRVPWKHLLKLVGCVAAFGIAVVLTLKLLPPEKFKDTPLERMITWVNRIDNHGEERAKDPKEYVVTDDNFQRTHANIAIANSRGVGLGPGNSLERDRLPQAYSDMIFAIIIEETGLFGAGIVIALYIFLLMRIWRIAKACEWVFLSYTVMGIGIMISIQALINMAVSVGAMPITGQPLPMISRGGTSMMMTSVAIGIILSVSRYAEAYRTSKERPEELTATGAALIEEVDESIDHSELKQP